MAKIIRETTITDENYDDENVAEDGPARHVIFTVQNLIYLIGMIIVILLGIRFLLSLFGANPANAFADFIYDFTQPLVQPFFNLFNYDEVYGVSRFEFETLVAMLVWGGITFVIVQFVNVLLRQTEINSK